MFRDYFIVAAVGLSLLVAGVCSAQESQAEAQRVEAELAQARMLAEAERVREEARVQMQQARRQLEEAARVIAVQARGAPGQQQFDFDFEPFQALTFGRHGRLGVTVVDAETGALVTGVSPESSAAEAGVKVGDVIVSYEGVALIDGESSAGERLADAVSDAETGDSVSLVVERAGQTIGMDVEIGEMLPGLAALGNGEMFRELRVLSAPNAAPAVSLNRRFQPGAGLSVVRTLGFASLPWSDMEMVAVSEGLGRYFDTTEGLLVVSGPEDEAIDIQDGDVILAISGRTPNSPEHAIRILSSFESGETVEFEIMRDGRRRSIEYAIPEIEAPEAGSNVIVMPVEPTFN